MALGDPLTFLTRHPLVAVGLSLGVVGGIALLLIGSTEEPDRPSPSIIEWDDPIEVTESNAHVGPWRMNESDWDYVDDANVALANDGTAGVIWADQEAQDLFFQAFGAEGTPLLDEPTNASQNPDTFSWLPRMIVPEDDPDTVYLLWQEIIFSGGSHGGEILFARSTDGGASFSDPINLSTTEAGAGKGRLTAQRWDNGSLDLAMDGDGTLYAAWTEYEGRLHVSRSTDGGASFSDPVHVTGDDATPARGPSLTVDTEGTVHLAWTVGEDRLADIYHTASSDQGRTFSEPRVAYESDAHADAPALTADSEGGVHLTFAEQTSQVGSGYQIRYAQLPAGADAFNAPTDVESLPSDAFEGAGFPTAHTDDGDTLYLLWVLYDDARDFRPSGLGMTLSQNGGASFSNPELVPGTADPALGHSGSQQGLLMDRLDATANGEVAVANSTFDAGESSRIWLHRGSVGAGE